MDKDFEQFKNSIEQIPIVKAEAHFELNDIAGKFLRAEKIEDDDLNKLDTIFVFLQDLNMKFVQFLDDYRVEEIINKEEFLMVVDYFLIAQQKGPESGKLLQAFFDRALSSDEFSELAQGIFISKNTREVLVRVYGKIL